MFAFVGPRDLWRNLGNDGVSTVANKERFGMWETDRGCLGDLLSHGFSVVRISLLHSIGMHKLRRIHLRNYGFSDTRYNQPELQQGHAQAPRAFGD